MFKLASKQTVATSLAALTEYVATTETPNHHVVIAGLHRVKMALARNAKEAVEAMGPIKADSRQDVMDGFKKENPDLTDAQLKEIGDEWEKNKNVVKDK